jgi:hypothetical protein
VSPACVFNRDDEGLVVRRAPWRGQMCWELEKPGIVNQPFKCAALILREAVYIDCE